MGLMMKINPVCGNDINFPVELNLSTQLLQFINNQNDSDKEILERGFHIEAFGEKCSIKCQFIRDALTKLLSLSETESKLFCYSVKFKNDVHSLGGYGLSTTINGEPVFFLGGVGRCQLHWYKNMGKEALCYKKEDIFDRKEVKVDQEQFGPVEIIKKKANKLFEIQTFKQILQKLEIYNDDDDFEIIIG